MDNSSASNRPPEQKAGIPPKTPSPPEDTTNLIIRAQAGDDLALEKLCIRFQPRLYRWATGRLPRRARSLIDTSDLVQETLVRVIRRLDGIKPRSPGAFPSYLRSTILNRIRDEYRKAANTPEFDTLDDEAEDSSLPPLEQTIGRDQTKQYEQALAKLKEDDQAAIFLRIELELSYEDLADALDRPSPDAARMAVKRALMRLARAMDDEVGQG